MECLQYPKLVTSIEVDGESFKPCYKWNAFNTYSGL